MTLLEYLADGASACAARLRGVESDMELAFAGLNQGTRGIRRGGRVPRGGPCADVRSAAASPAGASAGAGKACEWRARRGCVCRLGLGWDRLMSWGGAVLTESSQLGARYRNRKR